MKQIYSVITLITLLLVLGSCEKKSAKIIYDSLYKDEIKLVRKDVASHMASNYVPGANFAVAKDDKIIYSDAMGYASTTLDVPMTRKHKLRIGNLSELFTSAMYLKMVENGILHPDSTVKNYIQDYPGTDVEQLALKHLVYHTSGIRKEEQNESDWDGLNANIQKGLKQFMNEPLSIAPGSFEESSMFNTNLLGAIMEKTTKKNFSRLLKEYLTDTLKLTNTLVDNPISIIKGKSDFYHPNMMGQTNNAPCRDLRYIAPSKGILSNAEDLVKFGMAILESDYFSKEFTSKLFEPCILLGNYKSKMAHGWILTSDDKGRHLNARVGSVTGGGAAILIYPDEKLVVAYAENKTLSENNLPIIEIANHFLKEATTD
jgi:CubicO group peptidase (beta-lactamase class C family)